MRLSEKFCKVTFSVSKVLPNFVAATMSYFTKLCQTKPNTEIWSNFWSQLSTALTAETSCRHLEQLKISCSRHWRNLTPPTPSVHLKMSWFTLNFDEKFLPQNFGSLKFWTSLMSEFDSIRIKDTMPLAYCAFVNVLCSTFYEIYSSIVTRSYWPPSSICNRDSKSANL